VDGFAVATAASEDTRSQIIEAAGPIFAEKGFQAATVREICQAAGANLASVNYYFRDKERLYLATVLRASEMRRAEVPLPEWPSDTPPEERLRGFIRTIIERMVVMRKAPWQVKLMNREILQPTEACRDLIRAYFRPQFEMLLAILDEMLPRETPEHARTQLGFSIVSQCLFYRLCGESVAMMVGEEALAAHYQGEQLAEHIARVSLAALGRGELFAPHTTSPNTSSHSIGLS
jgi:TetR/AcrR family transcriptional regulator, regulator of cefoperazone and chloramphenicol sensitivity